MTDLFGVSLIIVVPRSTNNTWAGIRDRGNITIFNFDDICCDCELLCRLNRNSKPVIFRHVKIALLGELAAVTALIGGNLKAPGRITFQLQGHGLVSLMLVDCDEQLRLRGTAQHKVGAGETAIFSELLGDGQLMLTLRTLASTHIA